MPESFTDIADFNLLALLQVAVVIAAAMGLNFLATRHYASRTAMHTRLQVIQAVLVVVTLIIIVIIAPLGDSRRGQLLSFLGIVISAAIALSSTTVLGNAMAGLMLRSIKSFKPGDYISVGEHAGRVTEMDLLHTE
ncbi:MAG: mechanosensitive ion channel family protein, partial [Gammaproteobacteria bacterium]|nr:mechanosensitive ion channel family protein [Gammaproteobacteria bacterium]